MGRSGNPARRAAQERARARGGSLEAAARATFFCDESGNTGVHWGDPDQPVFVHGGWLIPNANQDALLAELPFFRRRYQLNATELKWQQLARRANGSAIFRDIFELMLANSSIPIFLAMDKDYAIAAKAVETFFDPAYNHFLPMGFTSDFDVKKGLAEHLLSAPSALGEFADLLRAGIEPDATRIVNIASQFADVLEESDACVFAEMLRHFGPDSLADIGGEFGADVWQRTTLGHSMFAVMERLGHFTMPLEIRIDIVHDHLVRFEELLGLVKGMFRDFDSTGGVIINGETRFFRMPKVDGMRLSDSKDEPFIQMADLLIGFVRTVFTKVKRGQQLDRDELSILGNLVMLRHEFYTWDVNVPNATFEQLQGLGWAELKRRFHRESSPNEFSAS